MRRHVEAALRSEHKVLSGPRTLLVHALLFLGLLAVAQVGTTGPLVTAQERWVRAALASAAVLGVLAWAERDRPERPDRD